MSLLIKYFACEALPAGDFQHSSWPFNLAQNAMVYPLHLLANIPMLRTEKTILHINLFCQVFFVFFLNTVRKILGIDSAPLSTTRAGNGA